MASDTNHKPLSDRDSKPSGGIIRLGGSGTSYHVSGDDLDGFRLPAWWQVRRANN